MPHAFHAHNPHIHLTIGNYGEPDPNPTADPRALLRRGTERVIAVPVTDRALLPRPTAPYTSHDVTQNDMATT